MNSIVSVIIPVFNKIEIIERCIQLNIEHATQACEWILIDNHSDQSTKDGLLRLQLVAQKKGHSCTIITETTNTGVAVAWNKGLDLATSDYICILNNDCVMMPHWDTELIKHAEIRNLAICTPFVVEPWMFNEKYSLDTFLTGTANWRVIQQKNFDSVRKGVFTGVVFFGKKSTFSKVGPFDEKFWLSLEEYDYLLRAKALGINTGMLGAVTAFHLGGITRNEMSKVGEISNQTHFEQKWGWNFSKVENRWFNRLIVKYRSIIFKINAKMSTLNLILKQNQVS